MSSVVTVILAAGKGERIGGPKALLAWPSKTKGQPDLPLCIAHAEARLAAESQSVVVVVRRTMVNALLMYVRPGIDLLSSTAADSLGPAGSLAFAVSRMQPLADHTIVTPVDTPPAKAETVQLLLARANEGAQPLAVRPRYNRRAGHPVVLSAAALAPYSQDDPPPLRDHLRAIGPGCIDEDVDDPMVLIDLDTASDVMALLRAPPRFF